MENVYKQFFASGVEHVKEHVQFYDPTVHVSQACFWRIILFIITLKKTLSETFMC